MSYKEEFATIAALHPHNSKLEGHHIKNTAPRFTAASVCVLEISDQSSIVRRFDFLLRIVIVKYGEALHSIPFGQLDREVLEAMHAKLTALGGTPPALPDLGPRVDAKINKNPAAKPLDI